MQSKKTYIKVHNSDNTEKMPTDMWEECMRIGEKELGLVFDKDTAQTPILDKAIPLISKKYNISINEVYEYEI